MATSKLQRKILAEISAHFGAFTIRENIKPPWLIDENGSRLEIDIFIEELRVGVEVQGQQHFKFVSLFHVNESGFSSSLARDRAKRRVCEENGVTLLEISSDSDIEMDTLIQNIRNISRALDGKSPIRSEYDLHLRSRVAESALEQRIKTLISNYFSYKKTAARESANEHPRPDRVKKYEKRTQDMRAKLAELGIDVDEFTRADSAKFGRQKRRKIVTASSDNSGAPKCPECGKPMSKSERFSDLLAGNGRFKWVCLLCDIKIPSKRAARQ